MSCSTLRAGMARLVALAASVLLLPTGHAAVISKIDAVPAGWTAVENVDESIVARTAANTHIFTIALTMQNLDQLESHLLSVSTPDSASYGRFLDVDDVAATYGASSAAVDAVTAWIESSGVVKSYAVNGSFVDLATDIAGANSLFGADYKYYVPTSAASSSASSSVAKLRTLSYAVPDDVAAHVALVEPGNYFGKVRAAAAMRPVSSVSARSKTERRAAQHAGSSPAVNASCQNVITPACLKQMYSVGSYAADAASGSAVGFGSFLNESALYSDLATYESLNGIAPLNFSVELFAGGVNYQNIDYEYIGEANLDVQNIVGISHPLPVTEYITGGSPPFVPNIDQPTAADNQNEPYVPYYRNLLAKSNRDLPQVISNSYGDEEDSVPYNYAVLTCNLIGLMGLRGITILESSGDIGVGAGCLAPDGKTVEFNAIFPATCPYLTSVGGTVAVTPEVAWEGSSGGFSKYFSRPAFQELAIGTYLLEHVSAATYNYYAPYTNWKGRGFPDVAAHSASPYYEIVYSGSAGGSGGTSAAAPVWAGIVALLNDARFRRGLPALGWLNPLLYSLGPAMLNDITSGHSVGCNGQDYQSGAAEPAGAGIVPGAAWNATVGWDPVTGYGTPNFEKMLQFVGGGF